MPNPEIYRWNGKIVSHKVYLQRLQQRQLGSKPRRKNLPEKKIKIEESVANENVEEPVTSENIKQEAEMFDGRRIVDLKFLGQQLWCVSCKEALSLEHIQTERRIGLASILLVRCHKCSLINEISTGKQKSSLDKRSFLFDVNYKSVIGALHSGLGWTHLQKLFASMNIPCFDFKTYKKYVNEFGLAAEEVPKESCKKAAKVKKEKTIQQSS